jgi:hypothetical protein
LRATRAISGYSVPIIACVTVGAGAAIRLFGPESMGGLGDIGARIDAETARTGLSDEEIGSKVHVSHKMFVDGLADVLKDISSYRRKAGASSWPSCYV